MIYRIWNATARAEKVEDYLHHLREETFPKLHQLAGFVEAFVLRGEPDGRGVAVQVVTVWESLESIKAFAGEDATVAVVPAEAQAMMVDFDERARHLELAMASRRSS